MTTAYEYNRAWRHRHPDRWAAQKTNYRKRTGSFTARNTGKQWSEEEDRQVVAHAVPDRELAATLGRSMHAIALRRHRISWPPMKDDHVMEPQDLIWKDPPAASRGPNSKWWGIAYELRMHPNQWAIIGISNGYNLASNLRNSRITAFRPSEHYEIRSVKDKDTGQFQIYARYVGPSDDQPTH